MLPKDGFQFAFTPDAKNVTSISSQHLEGGDPVRNDRQERQERFVFGFKGRFLERLRMLGGLQLGNAHGHLLAERRIDPGIPEVGRRR